MHKTIISSLIFSLLLISCTSSLKPQEEPQEEPQETTTASNDDLIFVYQDGKKVSSLLESYEQDCEDCYILKSIITYGKKITLVIPVSRTGRDYKTNKFRRFDANFSFETTTVEGDTVIAINYMSTHLQTLDIYLKQTKNKVFIDKYIAIQSETYAKKLGEDDYDYVPAVRKCVIANYNQPLTDTLYFDKNPVFDYLQNEDKRCVFCLESENYDPCLSDRR